MIVQKTGAAVMAALALFSVVSLGCSDNTRDSLKEDVNDAARSVDNAVKDSQD